MYKFGIKKSRDAINVKSRIYSDIIVCVMQDVATDVETNLAMQQESCAAPDPVEEAVDLQTEKKTKETSTKEVKFYMSAFINNFQVTKDKIDLN